jgi:DNA-binding beta-propeller fold protein YncE
VLVVRSLEPPEPSREPRVIEVLHLGGIPTDGVLAAGSLWVTDSEHDQVIRIDPAKRKVVARIPLADTPDEIATGEGGLWVRGPIGHGATRLWRLDPDANRVATQIRFGAGFGLAVSDRAIWVTHRLTRSEEIVRLDPTRGTPTARVPFGSGNGLAAAGRSAWALAQDGTVARIDAGSGRITRRWPRLARPGAEDASEAVVADPDGAWVLSAGEARILRLEGGVTEVIPVDESALPILARASDGLWVAAGDDSGGYRVMRIGVRSGNVTATVELGTRRPRALVPVAGGMWVVGGDGTAVLIDT